MNEMTVVIEHHEISSVIAQIQNSKWVTIIQIRQLFRNVTFSL